MDSSRLRNHPLGVCAFLVVFALVFFRLPFLFPVQPSFSASYAYHFNNRVAVLVFLAGAAAFAVLFRGLSLKLDGPGRRISRAAAAIAVAATVAAGVLVLWITLPFGIHGELVYFFSRVALLAQGQAPYRDFEFAYGPLLLYPAVWIAHGLHVSLIYGYALFWLLNWALGVWILYRLLNAIEISSRYRTVIFVLLVIDLGGSLWPLGLNYAPLRALTGPGLALLVWSAFRRRIAPAWFAALTIGSGALVTAVSPEHGIAFMVGTLLFLYVFSRPLTPGYTYAIGAVCVGFALVSLEAYHAGLYHTLKAFSSGAYNYPVMPTEDVLCVLALFLVAACVGYVMVREGRASSLTVYLLAISVFGLPSSFGRADSGHMQMAAISAVLIGALAVSRYPRIALVSAAVFFWFVASASYRGQIELRETLERRAFDPEQGSPGLQHLFTAVFHAAHRDGHLAEIREKAEQRARLEVAQSSLALPGGVVNAPFFFTHEGYSDASGNVDYGYFWGEENMILPLHVQEKIEWLAAHPERPLILPVADTCRSQSETAQLVFESFHGMHYASRRSDVKIYYPLCDYIAAHYAPERVGSPGSYYQVWRPMVPKVPMVEVSTAGGSVSAVEPK